MSARTPQELAQAIVEELVRRELERELARLRGTLEPARPYLATSPSRPLAQVAPAELGESTLGNGHHAAQDAPGDEQRPEVPMVELEVDRVLEFRQRARGRRVEEAVLELERQAELDQDDLPPALRREIMRASATEAEVVEVSEQ